MRVAITGARGLIGSRVAEIIGHKYDLLLLSSNDIDIKDKSSLNSFLPGKNIDVLVHLAAKADVDGCEEEKDLGEDSEAWKINVDGTKNVANFCKENNIKMIHISTDFVFDGEKDKGDFYTEEDAPNPVNFYAKTKYESEKVVQDSGVEYIILRIAYPYRKEFEGKKDFVRAIVERLSNGLEVKAVTDHVMCPTFIDDVAVIIDKLTQENNSGIYHSVGDTPLSPYDAAMQIAEVFNLDKNLISKSTRGEYFKDKASRPFNLYLKNDKIKNLGITTKSFKEGLLLLR